MCPSRRQATALALLPLVTACAGGDRRDGAAPASGAPHARRLQTGLGTVLLEGESSKAWDPVISTAAQRVARVWGPGAAPIRVVLCSSDAEFASASAGLGDMTAAVATPQGVYVGPSVARSLNAEGRTVVVAHELTHARLGHYGSDRTAMWLKEGAAEWTAEQGVTLRRNQLWPTLAALPSEQLPTGPPGAQVFVGNAPLAYETSAAYATYVVSVWGRKPFCDLVRQRPSGEAAQRALRGVATAQPSFPAWLGEQLT